MSQSRVLPSWEIFLTLFLMMMALVFLSHSFSDDIPRTVSLVEVPVEKQSHAQADSDQLVGASTVDGEDGTETDDGAGSV